MHAIENILTNWTKQYSNSYVLGVFGCSRKFYIEDEMTGCMQIDSLETNMGGNRLEELQTSVNRKTIIRNASVIME